MLLKAPLMVLCDPGTDLIEPFSNTRLEWMAQFKATSISHMGSADYLDFHGFSVEIKTAKIIVAA